MKKFFVLMMAVCAFGITAKADESMNAQQDDQSVASEQLFDVNGSFDSNEFHPRPGRPGGFRPAPRPFPRPMPRPIPRPFPRPYPRPFPRPLPRPYPHPVPRPYPPFFPNYVYECTAQDAYGRVYSDRGSIDPQYLQNNAVINCEQQSGTSCVALGCVRVY
jgi:hypothetical protein